MSRKKTLFRTYIFITLLSFLVICVASISSIAADVKSDAEIPQTFGVGLKLGGSHFGVGANVRYWSGRKIGFEVGYSHYSLGYSTSGFDYNSSVNQVIPSLLYAFSHADRPTFQIKPYIGGGINFSRYASKAAFEAYGVNEKESSTNVGGQGFAGLELTFKKLPKLTFGGDVGYYSTSVPYTGMKIGGFALGTTVHYYLK